MGWNQCRGPNSAQRPQRLDEATDDSRLDVTAEDQQERRPIAEVTPGGTSRQGPSDSGGSRREAEAEQSGYGHREVKNGSVALCARDSILLRVIIGLTFPSMISELFSW